MKRLVAFVLAGWLLVAFVAGCGGGGETKDKNINRDKPKAADSKSD
jgi:hypothetical protein